MTEALKKILTEAEGKTPLDFKGIYEPDSFVDPKPLDIAEKLCELNGVDLDTISIKELVEFGKAHIESVWNVQNKDGSIKQVAGYDISSVGIKPLKRLYTRWDENKQDPNAKPTKEEMETTNATFESIVKECGKIAYPAYPVQGSTIWEGRLALIDVLLVFNNFELSSLGKSLES